MPARSPYCYAIMRVVPDLVREEFVNVGVVLFCEEREFLGARSAVDEARVLALCPAVELSLVRAHLAALPLICAGGAAAGELGALPMRERWHWLVAPRSTILQPSAAHSGLCVEPETELARLHERLVVSRPR